MNAKNQEKEESPQFEFEEITIKVPKPIMDLLKFSESVIEQSPVEFAEMAIVKTVRIMVDSGEFLPDAKALATKFKLNPVFREVINDPVTS
jgi:hypothetical protein